MGQAESKCTAGKWRVDANHRREYPRVTNERGQFVADCASDADAKLIAEAPAMLAALREVIAVIDSNPSSIGDTVWVTGNRPETLYDHCRAAIAAATGAAA